MKKMKIIMQRDAMQCGIASLAMISNYFGRFISIEELSKICFASSEGVSLQGLCEAATTLGFHSIPGKVTIESLCNENLPCILHWNQNHFVVVYKIKKLRQGNYRVYVADPGKGLMTYTKEEFCEYRVSTKTNGEEKGIVPTERPDEF